MKILSSFTHLHVVPKLYDFIYSANTKESILKNLRLFDYYWMNKNLFIKISYFVFCRRNPYWVGMKWGWINDRFFFMCLKYAFVLLKWRFEHKENSNFSIFMSLLISVFQMNTSSVNNYGLLIIIFFFFTGKELSQWHECCDLNPWLPCPSFLTWSFITHQSPPTSECLLYYCHWD